MDIFNIDVSFTQKGDIILQCYWIIFVYILNKMILIAFKKKNFELILFIELSS